MRTSGYGVVMQSLRLFVKLVELSSFTQAAAAFGIAPATATRQVQALEEELGVRLLTRTTRICRPTEEGARFYEKARRIVELLDEAAAEAGVAAGRPTGRLRVSAPISFGRRHIAPLCAQFREEHPEVQVELDLTDLSDELSVREADVALRVGAPRNGDYIVRRVLQARRAICASPEYLERHGVPQRPEDLNHHTIVVLRRDGRDIDRWMFEVEGKMETVPVPVGLSSNSGEVVERWGLDGYGLMLKSVWDIGEYLRDGRLVEVMPGLCRERADIFIVFPDRRNLAARTRLFIDFVTERLAQFQEDPLFQEGRPDRV